MHHGLGVTQAAETQADGAYGNRLAERFGVEAVSSVVSRSLAGTATAITEVVVPPLGGFSDPLPPDDGFHISLVLTDLPDHRYWEDGRMASVRWIRQGQVQLHDARRSPYTLLDKRLHSLVFYLPLRAINLVADEANAPHIDELNYEPGAGLDDDVIRGLGMAVLPAMRAQDPVSQPFIDHLMLALAAHVGQTYGGMLLARKPVVGGLAPWQERRAKEILSADLGGDTPLAEIAQACNLSASYFARAFRRSTGLAPHAWLMRRRVEAAKGLLRKGGISFADVALACGFADQSHFTRVFSRIVGVPPGAWRRNVTE